MNDIALAQRIARLEAVHQIQNTMGRYSYWHTANMHRECLELFALNTPGVSAEMIWGVYEGAESLERLYPGYHGWVDGDLKGVMHIHALTTPVIEVAEDLQSAKAVWLSPGLETMSFAAAKDKPEPSSEPEAFWAWCKYEAVFVPEDGAWKIWHLHVHGIFLAPYDTSWVESVGLHGMPPMPEEYLPDQPPTTGWFYAPDLVYPNEPEVPSPYTSYQSVNQSPTE